MIIDLPPEVTRSVLRLVRSGVFRNAVEVVREGVRLIEERGVRTPKRPANVNINDRLEELRKIRSAEFARNLGKSTEARKPRGS